MTSVVIINPTCYAEENSETVTTQENSGGESTEETAQESSEGHSSKGASKAHKKKVARAKRVKRILAFANKQKGKPYRYGGFGPRSFDCIGFVYYVFAKSGVKLKTKMTVRKAFNLKKNFSKYIVSYNIKKAKAGDIIAYYSGHRTKHACIAIGKGKCISARRKGGVSVGRLKNKSGCKVAVIRIVK